MPGRPPRHLKEYHAKSAADLARGLAAHLANSLREAIEARGHALLAVSGGKSPIALFESLRQQPLKWANVSVILVDERCVAHDHPDSNTALVRQHLLQDQASAATLTPFFDNLTDPLDDAALTQLVKQANQRLARLHWPIDVAVLGMGEDGHTASLFPDAPGLESALRSSGPLAWVRPPPRRTLASPSPCPRCWPAASWCSPSTVKPKTPSTVKPCSRPTRHCPCRWCCTSTRRRSASGSPSPLPTA